MSAARKSWDFIVVEALATAIKPFIVFGGIVGFLTLVYSSIPQGNRPVPEVTAWKFGRSPAELFPELASRPAMNAGKAFLLTTTEWFNIDELKDKNKDVVVYRPGSKGDGIEETFIFSNTLSLTGIRIANTEVRQHEFASPMRYNRWDRAGIR